MTRIPAPVMLTCPQWGARQPKAKPFLVGRPDKIIEHHTDGHGAPSNKVPPSHLDEAIAYARAIQHLHMDTRRWNDSGHSFMVMRSGIILQGRWGTVTAIEHGRMVESAHCPGQNDNPGIEHEHLPGELFTKAQLRATVQLQAWICDRTGIRPTELYGHRHFFNTDCPDNLMQDILSLRLDVSRELQLYGRGKASYGLDISTRAAIKRELRG